MPPAAAQKRNPAQPAVRPRVKLWIESNAESVFCGGMCEILRAVEATGSIKHAAAEVDRSYRFIWARIKEAERALGHRLVETQVGGRSGQRSSLTPLAVDLLDEFESLRREIHHMVDDVFVRRLSAMLKRHEATNR